MARIMLVLGIAGTLAANAYSGSAHGAAGITLAMWPGVAFVGSAEAALSMVRRSAGSDMTTTAAAVAEPVSITAMTAASRPAIVTAWPHPAMSAIERPSVAADCPSRPAAKGAKGNRRAAAIVARNPKISGAELGRRLGLSERSGRRLLAELAAA
jgi:hypothetical protein